jgi:hypothetical protein
VPVQNLRERIFENKSTRENKFKQGCQVLYFQTKNPNLGIYMRSFEWKILAYFMAIGIFDCYFICFMTSWYILWSIGEYFSHFGMLYQ